MNKHYESVKEFMTAAGQEVLTSYKEPTPKLAKLRINLIEEEMKELRDDGIMQDDIVEIADALGDILVVTYGAYAAFGLGSYMTVSDIPTIESNKSHLISYSKSTAIIDSMFSQLESLKIALQQGYENQVISLLNGIINNVYESACDYNINIDAVFDVIAESNMSKFCKTEDDVEKSMIDLVVADKVQSVHELYYKKHGDYYVIMRNSDDKVLKGRSFHEPNLASIL